MMTTAVELCEQVSDVAVELGLRLTKADPRRRALPVEAIAHLRESLAALRRARDAAERALDGDPAAH